MQRTSLLYMTTLATLSTYTYMPSPAAAADSSSISQWINPQAIALDPVLLKTEQLNKIGIDTLLGTSSAEQDIPDILTPSTAPLMALPKPSALEIYYKERLESPIKQFGYDLFSLSASENSSRHQSSGAVQDHYILGQGDTLSILIRGQQNVSRIVPITTDGQLVIEDMAPIQAAGRSIKDVRNELQSLLGDYYNTDVFISLDKTRKISVTISGDVNQPGTITLSSFDTVMDALSKSGGIQKTGTLRQIKLMRGNSSTLIDLYGILIYGSGTSDLSLRDGDKIQIGPIGPTLAISGAVKRPGIYEILPANQTLWKDPEQRSQKLSLDDLLAFAGGPLAPGKHRFIRITPKTDGTDETSEVNESSIKIFRDGDILGVNKGIERRTDSVELSGHTRADGLYALSDTPTLSHLLSSESILGPDIYPLIGVIERWNTQQLSKELIAFSPKRVIHGEADIRLKESDRILLFSREEIANLGTPQSSDSQSELKLASLNTSIKSSHDSAYNPDREDESSYPLPRTSMKDFLLEHSAFIRGSIRNSGTYPLAERTTLSSLLAVAGGPSLEASLENIEITQPQADKTAQRININLSTTPANSITLHPGDTIRVNRKFKRIEDNHVLLVGEVRNPGTYDLLPGDTLSKLLERAGGITEQAYPAGAIFSRKSERLREEQRFKAKARDLELKLATALAQKDEDKRPKDEETGLAKSLIADLNNSESLGRLTVEADPGMLKTHPDMDILLETEDKIYIPKRPLTVRVAGEILSPASLQFRTGKNPRTYIDEAGGFTYNADQDRAFVVYPDGSASPLAVSAWNNSATMIPPGATIIVPRDPKPLSFMDGAKDLSQILANLATTAIFAEDIANDD